MSIIYMQKARAQPQCGAGVDAVAKTAEGAAVAVQK